MNVRVLTDDTENFMTGYRIVFDREDRILGWKPSDCKYCLQFTIDYSLTIYMEHRT